MPDAGLEWYHPAHTGFIAGASAGSSTTPGMDHMNTVTTQQLQQMFMLPASDKAARAAAWIVPLNGCLQAAAIDSPVRQAAFLAQVLVESAELQHVQELLNYSAARLQALWPSHITSQAMAEACSHHPELLANTVYANRMGNGDAASGDGWKYRGRGLIQITGRDNYTAYAHAMKVDAVNDPDLVLQPQGAALSAAWFWASHHLNDLADQNSDTAFVAITRHINGGINGLAQRREYWARASAALGIAAAPAA